jgi:hypothetical protein
VLVLKLSRGSFPNVIEHPKLIIWSWIIVICLSGVIAFYFYGVYQPRKRRLQQQQTQTQQTQTHTHTQIQLSPVQKIQKVKNIDFK